MMLCANCHTHVRQNTVDSCCVAHAEACAELSAHTGENGNEILVGCLGLVFDMGSATEFYGPGGN